MLGKKRNQSAIPILMYHQVDYPQKKPDIKDLYVTPEQFSWQMRMLKKLGYRGLSMKALAPYLSGQLTGKVVGITFDDGYANNFHHALPILKCLNFTATCYLVSNQIGGANIWDAEKGIPQKALMTTAEINQWLAEGMSIGSHTANHVDLRKCTTEELTMEITQSGDELSSQFAYAVTDFCYPYGFYNDEVVEVVARSNYSTATTTVKCKAAIGEEPLLLPRIPVRYKNSLWRFATKVL